ncbi:glutathione peroxidase [Mucilaginibacter ginkgonis]|uniref:Glutathione peroxidase n=1 Tax=Mucilaginibacter ginkgonis TaxID=2682091 RepID=A0A6I4INU4_9SPHI|nr:glutathione peroxidase [Mucilaginibacter ginkgonis]QQL48448.1 glutathione peroxidase [Mucilaginibacter ginkgonis]
MHEGTIYNFDVEQLNGEKASLEKFRDKVLLIVNTASQCGFTPQMADLVELKKAMAGKDFEILAFPSNDFGNQEPLEGNGLHAFCEKFDANFPMFNKMRVRGPYADPLFKFLSDKKQNGKVGAAPKWNFHKYLIDKDGKVRDFFYPFTKPNTTKVKKKIEQLLNQPVSL